MSEDNDGRDKDYNYTGTATNNKGYDGAGSLQIRLNTEPVIRQIELYLRGKTEMLVEENGVTIIKVMKIGEPLANEIGIQAIMQFVEIVFNPQVVQGNFPDYSDYEDFLVRARKDLAEDLIINLNKYGIQRSNYAGIMSKLMRFVETYSSRLIKNEERLSYASTIRTSESNTMKESANKKWGLF